ncbi:hypothetical protein [Pseudoalteromonas piscicida]|uniref:hypothetical protein n=1 Tax=Pseudoalteromonas piscicida TaxID=43662 RepID=UPI000E35D519|nr:hypothetical protein [Pseudoalteromonas piscicida]AXQ98015.1 hypothetical protein D0N37_09785 [Pseudoalteromonas piscicida]
MKIIGCINKNKYIILMIILVLGCCGFYYGYFGLDLNSNHQAWRNTTSYFNSMLTPILLFITALIVNKTWSVTDRGMRKSELLQKDMLDIQKSMQKQQEEFNQKSESQQKNMLDIQKSMQKQQEEFNNLHKLSNMKNEKISQLNEIEYEFEKPIDKLLARQAYKASLSVLTKLFKDGERKRIKAYANEVLTLKSPSASLDENKVKELDDLKTCLSIITEYLNDLHKSISQRELFRAVTKSITYLYDENKVPESLYELYSIKAAGVIAQTLGERFYDNQCGRYIFLEPIIFNKIEHFVNYWYDYHTADDEYSKKLGDEIFQLATIYIRKADLSNIVKLLVEGHGSYRIYKQKAAGTPLPDNFKVAIDTTAMEEFSKKLKTM